MKQSRQQSPLTQKKQVYLVMTGLVASIFTSTTSATFTACYFSRSHFHSTDRDARTRFIESTLDFRYVSEQLCTTRRKGRVFSQTLLRVSHPRQSEELTEKSVGSTILPNGTLRDPGMWPPRIPGRGSCVENSRQG